MLPPPFIRRLYLQRGMFLLADTAFDRKEMMTLRFPWHPSDSNLKEFRVLRDGGEEVDLLPDETSLTPVLELADRVVDGELKADNQSEIDALAYSLKTHFPQAYWNLGQMWAEYVDAFEEVLYAIAFDFNESGMLVCDQSRLAAIARNNAETCGSVAAFYRALPKLAGPAAEIPADKLAWQKRLADILDEIIAHECGYDHKAEARGYADWMGLHLDGREPN